MGVMMRGLGEKMVVVSSVQGTQLVTNRELMMIWIFIAFWRELTCLGIGMIVEDIDRIDQ